MTRLILLLALIPSLALAQHVQKIIVRYDPSFVSAEVAEEAAKIATYKHRQETGHKSRIVQVRPFTDNRLDLSDWSLRNERVDYLYWRFFKGENYTTVIVMTGPLVLNGKFGSAGAAYQCDRHGGVAALFFANIGPDQAGLIATHELGHILGSPHSPDWFQDIMHPDAQRVYYNTYGGFYRDTFHFYQSDFYNTWFQDCRKLSGIYRYPNGLARREKRLKKMRSW